MAHLISSRHTRATRRLPWYLRELRDAPPLPCCNGTLRQHCAAISAETFGARGERLYAYIERRETRRTERQRDSR
eukprot:5364010-Prymnesium_polylepis.2